MSRPITDYSHEEVREIILQGILAERKQPGTYFDPETGNKLIIMPWGNFHSTPGLATGYFVQYNHGPVTLRFGYTPEEIASIKESDVPA